MRSGSKKSPDTNTVLLLFTSMNLLDLVTILAMRYKRFVNPKQKTNVSKNLTSNINFSDAIVCKDISIIFRKFYVDYNVDTFVTSFYLDIGLILTWLRQCTWLKSNHRVAPH